MELMEIPMRDNGNGLQVKLTVVDRRVSNDEGLCWIFLKIVTNKGNKPENGE